MSQATPECDRTNEHLLDYAYGELSGTPLAELEKHLPGCERCQADLAALKGTRRVMATLAPVPAPAGGLESLLAYAEQQAKRQQKPARPKWLGWLIGAVPVAAAVVIVTSLSIKAQSPKQIEEEEGMPVAATRTEAAAGEAKNEPAKPVAPAVELAKAPDAQPAAAPAMRQPALEAGRSEGHLAEAPAKAASGSAKGSYAMTGKADLARVGDEKATDKTVELRKDKKAALAEDDEVLGGVSGGPAMGGAISGPGGGAGASMKREQQVAAKDARAPQLDAPETPRDQVQSANKVFAQATPVESKPATQTRSAKQAAQKEVTGADADGVAPSEEVVAGGNSNVASVQAPAAAPPPPPAPKPVAVAAAPTPPPAAASGFASADEYKSARPAAHAAGKKANVASTVAPDPAANADSLASNGDHADAAAAYFAAYQAASTTPRGATALFNAATESQKAGLLGQAAMQFERFAREFPKSASAPAALATAADIRRRQDGEGAATTLEQNLLDKYPTSPQAQEVVARQRRSHMAPAKKAKAEKSAIDFDDSAERAAPAPAAPAASETAK